MNCPNCKTINEPGNIFCVDCGATFTPTGSEVRVNVDSTPQQNYPPSYNSSPSIETSVFSTSPGNSNPSLSYAPQPSANVQGARASNNKMLWLIIAGLLVLLLAGGGYFVFNSQRLSAEVLPEHLGMFVQSSDKQKVDEIKKQDFANALDGKDILMKDETLPSLDQSPNLVLYSDGKDIPINDLRLIQLDTIKSDGTLKQLDFQAAPVDGKPEMKRIRVPDGIANGRYAFALFEGYLNEGKHKFWAFQVKNSSKSDNGDALKATSVSLKPKTGAAVLPGANPMIAASIPKPVVPPPPGGTAAVCISNNVILRDGPSQSTAKKGKLYDGQRLYVMSYSDRYETFGNKYANYAYIQTESGDHGWVFSAFIK
jgi:hypothetical protein